MSSVRRVGGGLKERCPAFFVFGDYRPLSREEEAVASFDERIKAVWPFIAKRIQLFQERLRPRERVGFDPEDCLFELYLALHEKDSQWEAARGRYITFVGALIRHEFCALRERSRTVKSPRNTGCRLKEYQKGEEDGTLTARQAETRAAIQRSAGDYDSLEGQDQDGHDEATDEAVGRAEERAISHDAVIRGLSCLSPYEAVVVGKSLGLWGQPEKTLVRIAAEVGKSPDEVGTVRRAAYAKIRDELRRIGHLAASESRD